MKKSILVLSLAGAVSAMVTGCSTPGKYIESSGKDSIVEIDKVNIQDFSQAAETMINSLLSSGALDRVPNPPALVSVSLIRNETGSQFDTDLLTKKIRVALSKSGKAMTMMNQGVGADGKPLMEDPLGASKQQREDFYNDGKNSTRSPDFTLSGKIIELKARAGNVRQSTFSFQLSLAQGNNAVWEDEKEITKQGKRASVGF